MLTRTSVRRDQGARPALTQAFMTLALARTGGGEHPMCAPARDSDGPAVRAGSRPRETVHPVPARTTWLQTQKGSKNILRSVSAQGTRSSPPPRVTSRCEPITDTEAKRGRPRFLSLPLPFRAGKLRAESAGTHAHIPERGEHCRPSRRIVSPLPS